MAVDPRYYFYQQRRRHLKDFDHRAKMILTDMERRHLYTILKDYQSHHQVEQLVSSLQGALNTPSKMDLLLDMRHFIPSSHLSRFDRVAPYHKMAHSVTVTSASEGNLNQMQTYNSLGRLHTQRNTKNSAGPYSISSLGRRTRSAASSPMLQRQTHSNAWNSMNDTREEGPVRTVVLAREAHENLGFSIRGGSEHGLGIYVSEMTEESAADQCGLEPGDQVLEVNSVSFENIASSSAVKVLTGTLRLKMTIRRIGKIPGFKFAQEKTSWYDTAEDKVIEGEFEDHSTVHSPAALPYVDGAVQRRVHLSIMNEGQFFGFNIRGGSEYGLGIYVSRIDHGGIGEQKGLKVGDQILEVNGKNFQHVTHATAVDVLRSQLTLIMAVRDVGKYPAYKEIYAEYSWTDTITGKTSHSSSGMITSVPVRSSPIEDMRRDDVYTEYDPHTTVGSFIQGEDSEEDLDHHLVYDAPDSNDADPENIRHSHHQYSENKTRNLTKENDELETESDNNDEGDKNMMNFPDAAFLSCFVPEQLSLSEGSTTETDDTAIELENIPDPLDSMLVPHSSDVILQERPLEDTSITSTKGKEKKKEKFAPRSQVGVLALQLENTPGGIRNVSKANLELIQSLRERGDINPRQFEDIELTVKKSRTFREMIFGTKSRAKVQQGLHVTKPKTRKPLSSIAFGTESQQSSPEMHTVVDVNVEKEKEDSVFVQGLGSQVMLQDVVNQGTGLRIVVDNAKNVLKVDEVEAVSRHLRRYETTGNLDALVTPILNILDNQEKRALLKEIRVLIKPSDLGQFDTMVSRIDVTERGEFGSQLNVEAASERTVAHSVQASGGHSKMKKHIERSAGHYGQRLTHEEDHREILAELARKKRNSLIESETLSPNRCLREARHNDKGKSLSNPNYTLELHRPKGRSKIYRAVIGESHQPLKKDGRTLGALSAKSSSSGGHASILEVSIGEGAMETLSVQMELTAEEPVYNTLESPDGTPSDSVSTSMGLTRASVYSIAKRESGSDLSSSQRTFTSSYSNMYDTADFKHTESDNDESDNDVVLLKTTTTEDRVPSTTFANASAALDFLDDLEDESRGSLSPVQLSPRTNASSSRASSPGFGSYDVTGSLDQFDSLSRKQPPVFVPPPPPSDPPPSEARDKDDWSEWITEDVSQEVMMDKAVGMTPRDSPRDSVSLSVAPGEWDNTWLSTPEPLPLSTTTVAEMNDGLELNHDAATPEKKVDEKKQPKKQQVNSLRDTLRARRKSGPRPSITNPAVFIPLEDLFPPEWGFKAQEDKEQEELVVENQTLSDCAPDRVPPVSPTHRSTQGSTPSSTLVSSSPPPPPPASPSRSELDSIHSSSDYQYLTKDRSSPTSSDPRSSESHSLMSLSGEEVHTFMTSPKPKGEAYLDQLWSAKESPSRQSSGASVEGPITVVLNKTKASLGLSISGGCDSRSQPQVKIQNVFGGGAAAEGGILQAGMRILAVDGKSLRIVSHPDAVDIVRQAYANKDNPEMELLVLQ